jgi:hypothetical protein
MSTMVASRCPQRDLLRATHPDLDLMLEHFEIRHDIHHLTRRELKSRHRRMDSLKQRSLQVCNWISETQGAKWGSIRNRTPTDFADCVTLRAVLADKYQTPPFGCRLLCEGEFSCTQQNCAPGKKWPSGLAPYH